MPPGDAETSSISTCRGRDLLPNPTGLPCCWSTFYPLECSALAVFQATKMRPGPAYSIPTRCRVLLVAALWGPDLDLIRGRNMRLTARWPLMRPTVGPAPGMASKSGARTMGHISVNQEDFERLDLFARCEDLPRVVPFQFIRNLEHSLDMGDGISVMGEGGRGCQTAPLSRDVSEHCMMHCRTPRTPGHCGLLQLQVRWSALSDANNPSAPPTWDR